MRLNHPFVRASAVAALALGQAVAARAEGPTAQTASPPSAEEVAALRREIADLREMVRSLQGQVAALAGQAGTIPPPSGAPQSAPLAPPAQPGAGVPPARSQNLLNPAISAVFQAIGSTSLRRQDDANGFDLSEAEIALQSVIDPYAKFDLFLSFPGSESPEVEEGYVTTLALPGSLQLKGGRFKSAFGKWNTLHNHAFFTVERPNALANFFGEESLTSDGMSLSVLVPNPKGLYIDSISEVGTARAGTSFNSEGRSLTYLEHLSAFFTPGPAGNLEVGLTAAFGKTGATEILQRDIAGCSGCPPLAPRSELASRVQGLDVTYKWRPPQRNVYRSFLWQTEALRSRRDVEVLTPAQALARDTVLSAGGYTYLEAQWTKRWRVGGRFDLSGFPDSDRARERAGSAILRFQPSEFQEIRLQYKRTWRDQEAAARFDGERDDDQIFFEWIPVIGAHGAHKF